ncbi:MAG: hypothetical protein ABDH59_05995 [Fervidobacterium sp.]
MILAWMSIVVGICIAINAIELIFSGRIISAVKSTISAIIGNIVVIVLIGKFFFDISPEMSLRYVSYYMRESVIATIVYAEKNLPSPYDSPLRIFLKLLDKSRICQDIESLKKWTKQEIKKEVKREVKKSEESQRKEEPSIHTVYVINNLNVPIAVKLKGIKNIEISSDIKTKELFPCIFPREKMKILYREKQDEVIKIGIKAGPVTAYKDGTATVSMDHPISSGVDLGFSVNTKGDYGVAIGLGTGVDVAGYQLKLGGGLVYRSSGDFSFNIKLLPLVIEYNLTASARNFNYNSPQLIPKLFGSLEQLSLFTDLLNSDCQYPTFLEKSVAYHTFFWPSRIQEGYKTPTYCSYIWKVYEHEEPKSGKFRYSIALKGRTKIEENKKLVYLHLCCGYDTTSQNNTKGVINLYFLLKQELLADEGMYFVLGSKKLEIPSKSVIEIPENTEIFSISNEALSNDFSFYIYLSLPFKDEFIEVIEKF